MIFTKNTVGTTITYTIDLPTATKTTYNTSTAVLLDTVSIATALPHTRTIADGVHKITLNLVGPTGTYSESRCILVNDTIECQLMTKIAQMSEKEKLASNLPYLWFLIKEGSVDQSCACVCDSIKTIYNDLYQQLNADCCC